MRFTVTKSYDLDEDVVKKILAEFLDDLDGTKSPALEFAPGDDRSHEQVAQDWIDERNEVVRG